VNDHIREHALSERGVSDRVPDLDILERTETNEDFFRLMRNRLLMGAFRYGAMDKNEMTTTERVAWIQNRLSRYASTGNVECLVDVANVCLVEFHLSTHSKKHFKAEDR